jgi:hypothetical protein
MLKEQKHLLNAGNVPAGKGNIMSMYGKSEDSPEKKKKREEAVKGIEDFFSGKTPRKSKAEMKAERESWKQKSMADVKARNDKIKADAIARDKADLSNLEKRHAELSATHTKGKNWMYADREQNLSDEERKARGISSELQQLSGRINAAKNSSYKQGGKINLKDCSVSTHEKNSKHKHSW